MVLGGPAPLPGEYGFLGFEAHGLLREAPPDTAERVLVAVDCAQESRIVEQRLVEEAPLTIDIDHHHDNTPLRRRQPRRPGRVVDGRGAGGRLRRARRHDDPRDRRGAVHGRRHRHGALPVLEHDAQGAPARGRARRAGRGRDEGVRRGLRVDAVPEAEAARACARACDRARGRAHRRLRAPPGGLRRRRGRGAVLGGHHRPPPLRRRRRARRARARAPGRRRRGAQGLAPLASGRRRRVGDRAQLRRRRPQAGRRVLDRSRDGRDHRAGSWTRSSPPTAATQADARPEGARADRCDPRRQGGGALVLRRRRPCPCADRGEDGSRGDAGPVRDRPPRPSLGACDGPPGPVHEARQALRDGDRPAWTDDDGRPGGRAGRRARPAGAGASSSAGSTRCAARWSSRSLRRRP